MTVDTPAERVRNLPRICKDTFKCCHGVAQDDVCSHGRPHRITPSCLHLGGCDDVVDDKGNIGVLGQGRCLVIAPGWMIDPNAKKGSSFGYMPKEGKPKPGTKRSILILGE